MVLHHHNKMALLITRVAEIFNLPNDDSDNELDREVGANQHDGLLHKQKQDSHTD